MRSRSLLGNASAMTAYKTKPTCVGWWSQRRLALSI